jgi:PAS domain S-box-containing protein
LIGLFYAEDRQLLEKWFKAFSDGLQPEPITLRRYWADGRLRFLSLQGELQCDSQGQPLRITGTLQDISERQLAMARLRESEQRFRSLFEHLPVPYQSLDIQGKWLDANPMMARLLGFERPEELLGLNFGDFWQDDTAAQFPKTFADFKSCGFVNGDLHLRRNDGATVMAHIVGYIQRDSSGRFLRTHCVLMDITERQAMEMEILALNADLEAKIEERTTELRLAMEAKSRFLANMSHEIRTPMNAVLGLAQMLEHEPLTEDQAAMVTRIRSAGRSLLNVINDILDFSKIEAGQFNIEQEPFKLTSVLKQVENLLGVTAHDKGLSLRIDDPAPVAGRLIGDALRLEQVLLNLTGNAIKFTETGEIVIRVSPVTVSAATACLRFEVTDSGIGMGTEALSKLFKPFSQADAGITRRFGGTGLGLSISKRLVELMGGAIGVDSTEGVGSTFWFELTFDRTEDEAQNAAAAVTGPRFQGLHLLVADDNQINRFLAERVLTREGATVTLVNDGQQAVDALRADPKAFDAVLMDIQMPVMDGLAATQAIREDLGLTDLPVIALTAAVMPEERQEALAAGVNDFLPKPMELERMATVIRSYCPAEVERAD